jgi:sugar lactone lactonase YvrE
MALELVFRIRQGCRSLVLAGTLVGAVPGWPAATVATLAGVPTDTGATPVFRAPLALAVDDSGNIFVSDTGNHAIRRITPAGVLSTYAGVPGYRGSLDGPAATALFNGPAGLGLDGSGNLYVVDSGNSTIRRITPGGQVSTLAGSAGSLGCDNGTGSAASFYWPYGIAVTPSGMVYVSDNVYGCVRRIDEQGKVTTFAGLAGVNGNVDGMGAQARFCGPRGMAIDASGTIYVSDNFNNNVRKITPAGMVTTLAGGGKRGMNDGYRTAATFFAPQGLAVDGSGNVFVADPLNGTIRRIGTDGYVTTFAGKVRVHGHADGPATSATFFHPEGLAVDTAGNVYVADTLNGTIRKITP